MRSVKHEKHNVKNKKMERAKCLKYLERKRKKNKTHTQTKKKNIYIISRNKVYKEKLNVGNQEHFCTTTISGTAFYRTQISNM